MDVVDVVILTSVVTWAAVCSRSITRWPLSSTVKHCSRWFCNRSNSCPWTNFQIFLLEPSKRPLVIASEYFWNCCSFLRKPNGMQVKQFLISVESVGLVVVMATTCSRSFLQRRRIENCSCYYRPATLSDFHIKAAICHWNIINEGKLADGRHFLSVAASSYFLGRPLGAFWLAAIRLIRSLTAVIAVCHHDQAQRMRHGWTWDAIQDSLSLAASASRLSRPSGPADAVNGAPLTLVTHKTWNGRFIRRQLGKTSDDNERGTNTHSRFLLTMSRVCGYRHVLVTGRGFVSSDLRNKSGRVWRGCISDAVICETDELVVLKVMWRPWVECNPRGPFISRICHEKWARRGVFLWSPSLFQVKVPDVKVAGSLSSSDNLGKLEVSVRCGHLPFDRIVSRPSLRQRRGNLMNGHRLEPMSWWTASGSRGCSDLGLDGCRERRISLDASQVVRLGFQTPLCCLAARPTKVKPFAKAGRGGAGLGRVLSGPSSSPSVVTGAPFCCCRW